MLKLLWTCWASTITSTTFGKEANTHSFSSTKTTTSRSMSLLFWTLVLPTYADIYGGPRNEVLKFTDSTLTTTSGSRIPGSWVGSTFVIGLSEVTSSPWMRALAASLSTSVGGIQRQMNWLKFTCQSSIPISLGGLNSQRTLTTTAPCTINQAMTLLLIDCEIGSLTLLISSHVSAAGWPYQWHSKWIMKIDQSCRLHHLFSAWEMVWCLHWNNSIKSWLIERKGGEKLLSSRVAAELIGFIKARITFDVYSSILHYRNLPIVFIPAVR